MTLQSADRVTILQRLGGDARTLADDVLDGLGDHFKQLPPKHLYDARGAALFDAICELPEYYPTRTERAILAAHAADLIALTGATELVELGSGTAAKTRLLLDAMARVGRLEHYVGIDVTEAMVRAVATDLVAEYESLVVTGIVGDFERHLDAVPPPAPERPRIVMVLGGTIGNLSPGRRRAFLRSLRPLIGEDGHLLIGADLVKVPALIEAAYNDSAGLTAEFNLNVLRVINRELGADFELGAFEHVAFFDRKREWIEMRLRASRAMRVRIAALRLEVDFAAGEEIRTEISCKFTEQRLRDDLRSAGLEQVALFSDPAGHYALALARGL